METFVVRIWTPADAGESFGLHGIVEHVGVAEARRFRGSEELLAVLRRGLEQPEPTAPPAPPAPHPGR